MPERSADTKFTTTARPSPNSTALHPAGTLMAMLPQMRAQSATHRSAVHRCLGILQVGHHAKLVILVSCPATRPPSVTVTAIATA